MVSLPHSCVIGRTFLAPSLPPFPLSLSPALGSAFPWLPLPPAVPAAHFPFSAFSSALQPLLTCENRQDPQPSIFVFTAGCAHSHLCSPKPSASMGYSTRPISIAQSLKGRASSQPQGSRVTHGANGCLHEEPGLPSGSSGVWQVSPLFFCFTQTPG